MLRPSCFYRKDIETCKKQKSKEKIELKFAIWQKRVKAKFPAEKMMLIYDVWILINILLL